MRSSSLQPTSLNLPRFRSTIIALIEIGLDHLLVVSSMDWLLSLYLPEWQVGHGPLRLENVVLMGRQLSHQMVLVSHREEAWLLMRFLK